MGHEPTSVDHELVSVGHALNQGEYFCSCGVYIGVWAVCHGPREEQHQNAARVWNRHVEREEAKHLAVSD